MRTAQIAPLFESVPRQLYGGSERVVSYLTEELVKQVHHVTAFLGEAAALVFPIDWPEPFGLAMIEAMACGTPVLAFGNGSVPEVVDEGITGLIVSTIDEAITALPRVLALDRRVVRRRFEERFSAARMARDYVRVYRSLLSRDVRYDLDDRRIMVPRYSAPIFMAPTDERPLAGFEPQDHSSELE
jgi:glycogen synthase